MKESLHLLHFIKLGLSPSKKKIICFNESPLKMMKMAFRFILKALVVLKIFKFFLDILVMKRKELKIRKIWLISKFMTSQPGKQTITIHILPNTSRSKGN